MTKRPEMNSASEKELIKVEEQFKAFDENVQALTMDRMNAAPKQEVEAQTKISQQDLAKKTDIYLKPHRTIGCRDKFNEKFREEYNFAKEYVNFIAENKEIIGEVIDMWTRPYGGMPAEWWKIPVNKSIWAPRYVAEQLKRCYYHRLVMQQNVGSGSDHAGQYFGTMAVDTTVSRLDAIPVVQKRSVFMGTSNFG